MNIYKNDINKEQRGRPTTPMQTNTGKYLQHKTKPKENEEQLQNIRVCVCSYAQRGSLSGMERIQYVCVYLKPVC